MDSIAESKIGFVTKQRGDALRPISLKQYGPQVSYTKKKKKKEKNVGRRNLGGAFALGGIVVH